jgi:hypothetical protein
VLLRFHFNYGDFVRWLSGEYTNRHRQWTKDFQTLIATKARPLSADYPISNYPRAFRICTKGVPLLGHFDTPALEIPARDTYNNHPAVAAQQANVEAKFVKEEAKSFHVHLPRFLLPFIYGLVLTPLQWALRKGKGRICVNCTNNLDPAGSANTYIPKPNPANADECPPIFYQHAFACHLHCLWRMQVTYPGDDLLQHCDDIEAAFHRFIYHPDLALVST